MPDLALQVMASNMTSSSTVLDITGGNFYHFYEEVITALDVDVIMNVGEYLRVRFALSWYNLYRGDCAYRRLRLMRRTISYVNSCLISG